MPVKRFSSRQPYPERMELLVVDAANVVWSRPDGWWRDRARAARRLHDSISAVDWGEDEVVLVVEGRAREGLRAGRRGSVRTVHADRSGDDAIVDEVVRQVAAHGGTGQDPPCCEQQSHRDPLSGVVIVNVCGSDDGCTPGTYIGDTCAGIARNCPGAITFTRYAYS